MEQVFDWRRIFFNDLPVVFLAEVVFRTLVMFFCLIITLKLAGKRGVKQLSIYEVVIIVALGSAAGDPMFYKDVGIVPALVVFIIVIGVYRFITFLAARIPWFERKVEGKPVYLIEEGQFSIGKFEKEALSQDEFFSELRNNQVEHLGQVRLALLETSGQLSVYFYEDQEVKPGLPILPLHFREQFTQIPVSGQYACVFCGFTNDLPSGPNICPRCKKVTWVKAIKTRRIS